MRSECQIRHAAHHVAIRLPNKPIVNVALPNLDPLPHRHRRRHRMLVDHRTRQPYGLLHGGASVALAETLGSVGAAFVVDRSKYNTVGLEINANHIRENRRIRCARSNR